MDRVLTDINALNATHVDGLLDLLLEMNDKLEKIQKSLDECVDRDRSRPHPCSMPQPGSPQAHALLGCRRAEGPSIRTRASVGACIVC